MPVWWIDGPKVRALREARGLSIGQLAQRAGFGVSSLRRMEQAAVPGSQSWPPNIVALAVALVTPVEELLGGDIEAFYADLARAQQMPSG